MTIHEYKKLKNNEYQLIIDDLKINLYDDIIIKHQLLLKKEITKEELDKIIINNDNLKTYYISLKYLSRKMRSILEVEKYLKKLKFNQTNIEQTISRLINEKYLDDKKFMISYINDQYNLTNNGPNKIRQNLIKLGIAEEDITINKDFTDKIKNIIIKRNKINHKLSTRALKTNISIYLTNLGYSKEMFVDYLDNIQADDTHLIKKEYTKLYNKYKNK